MIRNGRDEELARELYEHIGSKEETLKTAVYMILNIDCKESLDIAHSEVQKKLKAFSLNRILSAGSGKVKKVSECLHAPRINACSIKLAEKSREKRKQLVQGFTNPMLADILVATKKVQEKQNSLKKGFRAAQELKECTFHPMVSNEGLTAKNKCLSLYNLAKDVKKLTGRSKEEIEYEKSKNELTFTPTIHK
jgi:hypothetical protein